MLKWVHNGDKMVQNRVKVPRDTAVHKQVTIGHNTAKVHKRTNSVRNVRNGPWHSWGPWRSLQYTQKLHKSTGLPCLRDVHWFSS